MITKPVLGHRPIFAHPLTKGLVGCYLLNEGSLAHCRDLSGNGNHLTRYNGADIHTDAANFGPGVEFPYQHNERLQAADNTVFRGMSAVSWSVWMHSVIWGRNNTYQMVIGKSDGSGQREWRMRFEQEDGLVWHVSNDGNDPGTAENIFLFTAMQDRYYHFLGTYDGTTLNLYVDGVLHDTDTGEAGPLFSGTSIFGMGHYGDVGAGADVDDSLQARIDHAMVWDRALSAGEAWRINQNPFRMFERDDADLWVAATSEGGAPPGITIPIMSHHYTKNIAAA